jgi:signal transduction histidine kinase
MRHSGIVAVPDRQAIDCGGKAATACDRCCASPMNKPANPDSRSDASPQASRTHWLWRAPVADPVDRRNAPMLQVVLLLLGTLPPLMWAYRAFGSDIPWRPGELESLAMSLLVSTTALAGVLLIRRGRLQWAIRQMLVVIAGTVIASYALHGFNAGRYEQPLLVVWIVLAGLMVGRRALWLMYGAVVLAFVLGTMADARTSTDPIDTGFNLAMNGIIHAVMFLLIAVVVDRSVTALRESLADATSRGDALARSHRLLEAEMAERERVQEQLIHARKVDAVGRLAGGIAHDFNHLLALILGYAEKGRRLAGPGELRETLAGIEAAGRRASAVTRKLLNFSRQDETRVECFDAGDALRELAPMLRQALDPGVRLEFDLADEPLPIEFDRAQFDLIALNLASNANHAMPRGGRFSLAVRRDGDGIALAFSDDGVGMSDEVRARAFEPFFSTKPVGQGVGLGLSVTHDLVVAAGGRIEVHSAPGRTTFRIRLPIAQGAMADA